MTVYYSAIKKDEILPFATTWMDLERVMLSEIGQTEKDKYRMLSLICDNIFFESVPCVYYTVKVYP